MLPLLSFKNFKCEFLLPKMSSLIVVTRVDARAIAARKSTARRVDVVGPRRQLEKAHATVARTNDDDDDDGADDGDEDN